MSSASSVSRFDARHPEVLEALADCLESLVRHRPALQLQASPEALALFAARLQKHAQHFQHVQPPPLPKQGEQPPREEDAADVAQRRHLQQRMGSKRRGVVFSEPVRLEADWAAPVVPKTPAERHEILVVLRANALLSAIADESELGEDECGEGEATSAVTAHPRGTLSAIVGAMFRCAFAPGDVIIRQGDAGDNYYVISEGQATISVNGATVLEATRGMGFGELALLYDAPRAATVVAGPAIGCSCWAIDRMTFRKVLIGATVRKRERYSGFLEAVPVLRALSSDEIHTVADALHPVAFAAGAVVLREGDCEADPRFFIVESGELRATKSGVDGEVCPRLVAGDFFGEKALLSDAPRAATVSVASAGGCVCLAMDKSAFYRIMGPLHARLRVLGPASRASSSRSEGGDVAV